MNATNALEPRRGSPTFFSERHLRADWWNRSTKCGHNGTESPDASQGTGQNILIRLVSCIIGKVMCSLLNAFCWPWLGICLWVRQRSNDVQLSHSPPFLVFWYRTVGHCVSNCRNDGEVSKQSSVTKQQLDFPSTQSFALTMGNLQGLTNEKILQISKGALGLLTSFWSKFP